MDRATRNAAVTMATTSSTRPSRNGRRRSCSGAGGELSTTTSSPRVVPERRTGPPARSAGEPAPHVVEVGRLEPVAEPGVLAVPDGQALAVQRPGRAASLLDGHDLVVGP